MWGMTLAPTRKVTSQTFAVEGEGFVFVVREKVAPSYSGLWSVAPDARLWGVGEGDDCGFAEDYSVDGDACCC